MCKDCDWEEALEELDEMLEEDRYEFAVDTLEGIREWILDHEHCTPDQYDAIQNIKRSVKD